ncbi:MAG: hypothetical protein ACRD2L_07845, partial [Terriglobia bacterium]
ADIRLSFRTWLPSNLQEKVFPFEEALRKLGSRSIVLESIHDPDKRSRVVDEMYQEFDKVLDLRLKGKVLDERVAPEQIMDQLQEILGVKQLIHLRIELVDEAVKALERKS